MSKFIGRLLVVLALGWSGVASAVPITGDDAVTVGDTEWAQPDLFAGLTWNYINTICPGGVCDGELNGYNVTGMTWANVTDVNDLFNTLLGDDVIGPWPDNTLSGAWDSPWGSLLFDASFRPITSSSSQQRIEALTSKDAGPRDAYSAYWLDITEPPGGTDRIWSAARVRRELPNNSIGAWLYRDAPAAAPTPATIPLLGIALAALGLSRRRYQNY
jgi:hypothetical protein